MGGIVLHDSLSRAVAASQQAGGRRVVVDAIDDNARQFYGHYGFTSRRDQNASSARSATSKPTSRLRAPQRLEWLGLEDPSDFDSAAFDLASVNARLRGLV